MCQPPHLNQSARMFHVEHLRQPHASAAILLPMSSSRSCPFASRLENCYRGSRREFYEATATCDLDQGDVPHSPAPADAGQVYRGHAELPPAGAEVLRLGI